MRVAVVGATGMIGHHAAAAVAAAGHELRVVHRAGSNLKALGDLPFEPRAGDLNDRASLSAALEGAEAVINCAAYYPTEPRPWREEVALALAQSENFYAACAERGLRKIVYVGAAIALARDPSGRPATEEAATSERPRDLTPYVQVKWEMDRLAVEKARRGLPVVVAIPAMCFGEYDAGPSTGRLIVEVANRTLPGYVGGRRNVVYAGDAGRGLLLACERGRAGERYLLTGENVTMDELVRVIAEEAGVEPPRRAIPLGLARVLSKLQEARYRLLGGEVPRLSSTAVAVMALGQFLDGSKAGRELGYEPHVGARKAVARALAWFRAHGYVKAR
ncbi:MAG TPA: NAD-dependent epimerase/dehydratase family protein [Pyrinomonadaceae bacterium]|nr:NAD-dependent epimerase/dehydratase family protein [Pyrinomonadaceae bacterium]